MNSCMSCTVGIPQHLLPFIGQLLPRVHNIYIYTEESILLSYTPVEGHIVKLWHNTSEFAHFSLYN